MLAENKFGSFAKAITMIVLTSQREKRFWILALVVQITIYATLGFVNTLVGLIPDRNIIDYAFLFGMLLIVISAVIIGVKNTKSNIEIGVGLGVIAVYLLVFLRMNIPQERTHLIEYGVVAILIYEALKERLINGGNVTHPALIAIVITSITGVLDECIQFFLPNRVFDFRDILFNILAGIMGISAVWTLNWAKRKSRIIREKTGKNTDNK